MSAGHWDSSLRSWRSRFDPKSGLLLCSSNVPLLSWACQWRKPLLRRIHPAPIPWWKCGSSCAAEWSTPSLWSRAAPLCPLPTRWADQGLRRISCTRRKRSLSSGRKSARLETAGQSSWISVCYAAFSRSSGWSAPASDSRSACQALPPPQACTVSCSPKARINAYRDINGWLWILRLTTR